MTENKCKLNFNQEAECIILVQNVYLDDKELLPFTIFSMFSAEYTDEEYINNFTNKNSVIIDTMKDLNNNDLYIIINYSKYENDNESNSILSVYDENLNQYYTYVREKGRPFIWLTFSTKEDAEDRNGAYNNNDEYDVYMYNSKVIGGGVSYDVHENYLYLLDTKFENCTNGVTEYKINFKDGKINKTTKFYRKYNSEFRTEQMD